QAVMIWTQVPVPVIAAVHGVAFGGGLQVALGADLRYVTPDARMCVMEIKWGLVPDMGGALLMRTLMRADVIRELTYTGRIVDGVEAQALGLATRVCADPYQVAMETALEMTRRNPEAMRAAKRLLTVADQGDPAAILLAESVEQARLIGSSNQAEAVRISRSACRTSPIRNKPGPSAARPWVGCRPRRAVLSARGLPSDRGSRATRR
ncbi:MAG: enoyl-CoA hydratase-related protein, partial [Burkholderiales bacterium]|nr:enoyl-CoA hydratase-related protein [Burkholderiales bacterium]